MVLIPELNNRIQGDGFENINVIDSNNVLIAAEKGFFHLNYGQYKKNRYQLSVFIRNVHSTSQGDSLVFGGHSKPSAAPSLAYAYNSLHFESSSTLFGQEPQMLFHSPFLRPGTAPGGHTCCTPCCLRWCCTCSINASSRNIKSNSR